MEISESFQENNITKLTAIQPSNSKVQYGYKKVNRNHELNFTNF